MRSIVIVLTAPGLEYDRRLAAVREELPVQALVAEAPLMLCRQGW